MIPALALTLLALGAGPLPQDVRVAVVAGSNRGLASEQPLEYAEDDARRVHALLTELGGVSPRRAALVLGGGPEAVLRAVSEAVGQARELSLTARTTLLFYASAHADEASLHLDGEALPLARLREALAQAPAQLRVVIIDACRVPVSARGKGGRPGPEVPVVFDQSALVEGEVFLAAAGPGERAQEWAHLRGALFTHHLLTGLRGAADFDGDGQVTLAEAYAYSFRTTLSKAAEAGLAPQRPSFDFKVAGHGDWVFSHTGAAGAQLTLASDLAGRTWITDARGQVVAELDKRAGEPVRLALVPGRYRVVRLEGAHAHAADVSLAYGGERLVTAGSLVRITAAQATGKGGPPEPLRPWGLSAAYALERDGGAASAEHGLELGVERAFGDWAFRLGAGGGGRSFQSSGGAVSQRDLRLSAALTWTFPVWVIVAGVGLEARPRVVWQRFDPRSPELLVRLYGSRAASERALLLAVGPLATLTWPVLDRWSLGVDLSGGAEVAPDAQGRVGLRWYAQPRVQLGWSR